MTVSRRDALKGVGAVAAVAAVGRPVSAVAQASNLDYEFERIEGDVDLEFVPVAWDDIAVGDVIRARDGGKQVYSVTKTCFMPWAQSKSVIVKSICQLHV